MKTQEEINAKKVGLNKRLSASCPHQVEELSARNIGNVSDSTCDCRREFRTEIKAFEACIPKKFWNITREDVIHNEEIFDEVIAKYCEPDRLRVAGNEGFGLYLTGENGCGKTMFLSYILMHIIKNTRASAYYTTALQLDHDLKLGFKDVTSQHRLERYMTSHFVVIDEVGKETFRKGDSFNRREFEYWLRAREERSYPTFLASNLELKAIRRSVEDGGYGETIGSLIEGNMLEVTMEPGDMRKMKGANLRKKMGFA